ncbi:Endopolyphosphatase [Borealophlyctis nickersoniae]|nr:Endopolyphosphatase [Borealophlyctis nickersoniae]
MIVSTPLVIFTIVALGAEVARAEKWRFIQITDLHLDPFYGPNTDPDTACHRGSPSSELSRKGSHYGVRGSRCDSPFALLEDTFSYLRKLFADEVDFVLWTGDSSRHDRDKRLPKDSSEVFSQNAQAVNEFVRSFNVSSTPVIPSIGNWDVWPSGALKPGPNEELRKLYETWKPLLGGPQNASIEEMFLQGGYFSREAVPGKVTVLSLNTLYWFEENVAITDCSPFVTGGSPGSSHPGDIQLNWLIQSLENLRTSNQRAILIGHVPPVNFDEKILFYSNCYKWFSHVSGNYSDTILAQYYGHTNEDALAFVAKRKGRGWRDNQPVDHTPFHFVALNTQTVRNIDKSTLSIVGAIYTGPSVVPAYNPGFRVGSLGTTPYPYIADHVQWYADIDKANRRHERDPDSNTLKFTEACHTHEDFALHNLTANAWSAWLERVQDSDGVKRRDEPVTGTQLWKRYKRCVVVNTEKKAKKSKGKNGLHLGTGLVWGILVASTIMFLGALIAFFAYVRRLDSQGSALERQRLLFAEQGRG